MSKPFVVVNLDRPRKIKYTINALATLEDILERPVTELGSNVGVRELRALLWAGLLHEDANLTLEQAGNLMDEIDITILTEKIGEALNAALGGQKNAEKVAAVGTGEKH